MGDGFHALDIILFAMIAAFIVLRLRSVLGRRTGHERRRTDAITQARTETAEGQHKDNVIELPDNRQQTEPQPDAPFAAADSADPVAAGLTQIRIADTAFDRETFLTGARAAFEMIVQAYADGDVKTLRNMLNDEVYDNFSSAVADREKASEKLETTVIGISSADIIEARVDGRMAFVTVKFVSEQVNVTRDKDGNTVDGDPNNVAKITDIWTFARNTRARDPNWTLVETRSPN